jgi:hypothetical protein
MTSPQDAKMIRALMEDPRWGAVERSLAEYFQLNFMQNPTRMTTEFDTIWHWATQEGGKNHLEGFFNGLEAEARNADVQ